MRLAHCRAWRTIASFPRWCAAFSGAGVLSSWLSYRHRLGAGGRKKELGFGERLDKIESGVRSKLAQKKALGCNVDDSELGDDVINDLNACEREGALFHDFGLVVASGVFHGDENALGAGDQIH